jgi:hypothetical protein
MFRKLFLALTGLLFIAAPAFSETIHLNSGESLKGKIQGMDEQRLILESNITGNEIRIERPDLRMVEFEAGSRSLSRRMGFGLHYRPAGAEEALSLKNWVSPLDSIELLLGYEKGGRDRLLVEGRFARVFAKEGIQDLFFGVGAGLVNENDQRGTTMRVFGGGEFFPISTPNFGFSFELGALSRQGVDPATQVIYNAVSARYYF